MRVTWALLFRGTVLVGLIALTGCGAGGGAPSGGAGPRSAQARTLGAVPIGSALFGLHAGDRIPAQGRTVTAFSGQGKSIALDAPLVLYPHAVVQGVAWIPTPPTSELWVLLGTDDPEATVRRHYAAAWQGLSVVQPKPRPSLVYGKTVPNVLSQSLLVRTSKDYAPSVEIQRGPAVQPMDEHQYAQVLLGNATLPLQPGTTLTEICVVAPVG